MHALRRQRHLQETKQAVLFEQARQRVLPPCERSVELLAHHAATASRRARTFAELLGQADAWVARQEEACHDDPKLKSPPDSIDALIQPTPSCDLVK